MTLYAFICVYRVTALLFSPCPFLSLIPDNFQHAFFIDSGKGRQAFGQTTHSAPQAPSWYATYMIKHSCTWFLFPSFLIDTVFCAEKRPRGRPRKDASKQLVSALSVLSAAAGVVEELANK